MRLFFAFEIMAPWPEEMPKGRILDESARHMTVAFLGEANFEELQKSLNEFPLLPFKVGLAGHFDKILFLPERHPHVAAWHLQWHDQTDKIESWQKSLFDWLEKKGFSPDRKRLLPHVTICRPPFFTHEWKEAFQPLPLYIEALHLYHSKGNLTYQPVWTYPFLKSPIEEIEHTADIAFIIRGEDIDQLYRHACIALSFKCPQMMNFFYLEKKVVSLDDIVIELNAAVAKADAEIGCPFKAISFHGEIENKDQVLEWRMIIDV